MSKDLDSDFVHGAALLVEELRVKKALAEQAEQKVANMSEEIKNTKHALALVQLDLDAWLGVYRMTYDDLHETKKKLAEVEIKLARVRELLDGDECRCEYPDGAQCLACYLKEALK